jgi:hypothetical protein
VTLALHRWTAFVAPAGDSVLRYQYAVGSCNTDLRNLQVCVRARGTHRVSDEQGITAGTQCDPESLRSYTAVPDAATSVDVSGLAGLVFGRTYVFTVTGLSAGGILTSASVTFVVPSTVITPGTNLTFTAPQPGDRSTIDVDMGWTFRQVRSCARPSAHALRRRGCLLMFRSALS